MSKHTPAPWKIVPRETFEDGSVYPAHITGGARDLEICPLETDYAAANFEPCDVMHEADGDIRSRAANARLIAAAPELLAALQFIRDIQNGPDRASAAGMLEVVVSKARAAITKATGAA